jgi:hypothetical protein
MEYFNFRKPVWWDVIGFYEWWISRYREQPTKMKYKIASETFLKCLRRLEKNGTTKQKMHATELIKSKVSRRGTSEQVF